MRERIAKFMQGRYGVDHLSQFLIVIAMILMIFQMFIHSIVIDLILNMVAVGLLFFTYFRIFSRNHYKRYAENQKYLHYHNRFRGFFVRKKSCFMQRKTHRIFKCPNCKQSIRVPKGKGKIAITCPKCKNEFIKRS